MEQSSLSKIATKIIIAVFAVAVVDLIYLNYWAVKQDREFKESRTQRNNEVREVTSVATPAPVASASPGAKATVTPSPSPIVKTETIVTKETKTIVQTAQKEIFIPIGSGSTFSGSYVNLAGLEVTIDTTKYGAIDSVVFEGSIWVQDGNGKMYAQLFNKTDGYPVWNSEISTSSGVGTLTTSSKVSLTSGNKTYAVQAKTNLTPYAAHVENARVKITLK